MNKNMKPTAQGGFTLIELIVVIVILGILAATALPKFADMGGDARSASVSAAKAGLESTSAMLHGKSLMNAAATTITVEGVTVDIKNGYPAITNSDKLQAAAGLGDWTLVAAGTAATDNSPLTGADEVAFIPKSVAGTPKGLSCYVKYKEAASTSVAPTISTVVTSC